MVQRMKQSKFGLIALVLVLLLGIVFAALVAIRLITGRSLGLRGFVESRLFVLTNPAMALLNSRKIAQSNMGEFTNIVFLHHSTGSNLIRQGNVRSIFQEQGFSFWDHGYNEQGLREPEGTRTGYNYRVPQDNTDPDGLAAIFGQKEYSLPLNTLSALLQHEVIIIKSCFEPANRIKSDEQLEQYKDWYLGIRDVMDKHPEKLFIIMTTPPINPARTNLEHAARARDFANWLKSDEFLSGHPNVHAFDFFDLLAENNPASPEYNMLITAYREGTDSHPNQFANETIGPVFAQFVVDRIQEYRTEKINGEISIKNIPGR